MNRATVLVIEDDAAVQAYPCLLPGADLPLRRYMPLEYLDSRRSVCRGGNKVLAYLFSEYLLGQATL